MNRRGFLKKGLAAAVAAAVAPLLPKETKAATPKGQETLQADKTYTRQLFEMLLSKNPRRRNAAVEAINDFTRMKMREPGLLERICPVEQVLPGWKAGEGTIDFLGSVDQDVDFDAYTITNGFTYAYEAHGASFGCTRALARAEF